MLTVLTPAASQDLATLEAAKAELGVVGTADDATIERMIRQASGDIADFCDRVFIAEDVREQWTFDACYWSGDFWRYYDEPLKLARWPVISITSITDDEGALLSAGYELDPARGLLWRRRGDLRSSWWSKRVTVDYRGGYEPGTVPAPLERVCLDLIRRNWHGRGRDPALRSETVPGIIEQTWTASGSEQVEAGGMPSGIAQKLWFYRDLY